MGMAYTQNVPFDREDDDDDYSKVAPARVTFTFHMSCQPTLLFKKYNTFLLRTKAYQRCYMCALQIILESSQPKARSHSLFVSISRVKRPFSSFCLGFVIICIANLIYYSPLDSCTLVRYVQKARNHMKKHPFHNNDVHERNL